MKLDVSMLSRHSRFEFEDGLSIELSTLVLELEPTIKAWMDAGLIKRTESFGFAMAKPYVTSESWDDPYKFVEFVVGWGTEGDRYIANAVRKLRAALRTGKDTAWLRINDPGQFQGQVESVQAGGTFKWGDFPWGGATLVQSGSYELWCSVSALKEVEDDWVAKAIGGLIGATLMRTAHPTEDMFG